MGQAGVRISTHFRVLLFSSLIKKTQTATLPELALWLSELRMKNPSKLNSRSHVGEWQGFSGKKLSTKSIPSKAKGENLSSPHPPTKCRGTLTVQRDPENHTLNTTNTATQICHLACTCSQWNTDVFYLQRNWRPSHLNPMFCRNGSPVIQNAFLRLSNYRHTDSKFSISWALSCIMWLYIYC